MAQAFLNAALAPCQVFLALLAALAAILIGRLKQPVGRILAAVENDIFNTFTQFRRDIFIDRQLARIDDAHIHARLDGVIQEHRVHRLAHQIVTAE